jgi:hypothetical protein
VGQLLNEKLCTLSPCASLAKLTDWECKVVYSLSRCLIQHAHARIISFFFFNETRMLARQKHIISTKLLLVIVKYNSRLCLLKATKALVRFDSCFAMMPDWSSARDEYVS